MSRSRGLHVAVAVAGASVAIVPMVALPLLGALHAWRRRRAVGATEFAGLFGVALVALVEVWHGSVPVVATTLALAVGIRWSLDEYDPNRYVRRAWSWGIAGGLALTSAVALYLALASGTRVAVWPWTPHANLFAHTVVALTLLGIVRGGPREARLAVLLAAFPALVFSGSRAALLAWLPLALLASPRRWRGVVAVLAIGLMTATLLATPRGRSLGIAASAWVSGDLRPLPNLLLDTDDLDAESWRHVGTRATPYVEGDDDADEGVAWWLERTAAADPAGPRQLVPLEGGRALTLAAEVWTDDAATRPGMMVTRRESGQLVHHAQVTVGAGPRPAVRTVGALELRNADARRLEDGWLALRATLTYAGKGSEAFRVGPILAGGAEGDGAAFRDVHLVDATYRGTPRSVSASERNAWTAARTALQRRDIWREALAGIAARPWLGHGGGAFVRWYAASVDEGAIQPRTPTHPHALPLHVGFSYGIAGLIGAALVGASLIAGSVLRREGRVLIGVALLGLMNTVDISGIHSGVMFALAAMMAVRSEPSA